MSWFRKKEEVKPIVVTPSPKIIERTVIVHVNTTPVLLYRLDKVYGRYHGAVAYTANLPLAMEWWREKQNERQVVVIEGYEGPDGKLYRSAGAQRVNLVNDLSTLEAATVAAEEGK